MEYASREIEKDNFQSLSREADSNESKEPFESMFLKQKQH